MQAAAITILMAGAIYLIILGLIALVRPGAAYAFLSKFAQTTRANIIEMSCRFIVGSAFAIVAPLLPGSAAVRIFGLVLMASAVVLLATPQFHRRFANRVVPAIETRLPLVGLASLVGGIGLAVMLLPLIAAPPSPY